MICLSSLLRHKSSAARDDLFTGTALCLFDSGSIQFCACRFDRQRNLAQTKKYARRNGRTSIGSVTVGTRLAVIDVYNNGEVLQVDSFYAPWYKVRTKKGNIGFVFGAFVSGAYIYYENEITFDLIYRASIGMACICATPSQRIKTNQSQARY